MKKYEVLYDWPVAQIKTLADSTSAETFASTLGDGALDEFVDITEKLREQAAALYQAKASRQHSSAWGITRDLVDSFAERFAAFPNVQLPKIRVFLLLCDMLAQLAPDLDAEEIDASLLKGYEVSARLPDVWFARHNSRSFDASVVFLKPRELSRIQAALVAESASPRLLFHVLAAMSSSDDVLSNAVAFLKTGQQRSTEDVEAFLKLHLLMNGRQVHVPKTITRTPSVNDPDAAKTTSAYGQWNDLLLVLSEYNARGELLLKFLTIYQAFENLMFKCPIVKLERAKNGAMFSLREFKALYTSVNVNEQSALEGLFKAIFPFVMGADSIKVMVENEWIALEAAQSSAAVETEMTRLGVKLGGSFAGASSSNYAKIVYAVRNSIVHNKETEFHLTSDSLTDCLCSLIEDFLLPTLERIIFHVVSIENDQLWYKSKQLVLY